MTVQRIITIVNLVLITLIAYFGIRFFYQVVGIKPNLIGEGVATQSIPTPQTRTDNHPLAFYSAILERDLFKTQAAAPVQTTSQSMDVDNLEKTQLKLKLWGTVSGDPQTAYAVIEDIQKHEQDLYRVGDTIQDATLKAILREKVVLSVTGRDEMLSMEEAASTDGPMMAQRQPPDSGRVSPDESMGRAQRVALNRSMIDEAMQDVSKLMTEIVVTPHMEEGQSAGLALSNIKPNSIFRRMGLRNGDVLVGVDGQEIRSVDDALRFYESLKSSSDVKVQINRRGQERIIDYNIR